MVTVRMTRVCSIVRRTFSESRAFSHHYPPVCSNVFDTRYLGCMILAWSHFVFQIGWLYRLIVVLATRFVPPDPALGPYKMALENRVLVFRSTTVRLSSLSGTLDIRRQLCTRIPCLFLLITRFDQPTADIRPYSPSTVWRRPTTNASGDSQAASTTRRPYFSSGPIESHWRSDREEA